MAIKRLQNAASVGQSMNVFGLNLERPLIDRQRFAITLEKMQRPAKTVKRIHIVRSTRYCGAGIRQRIFMPSDIVPDLRSVAQRLTKIWHNLQRSIQVFQRFTRSSKLAVGAPTIVESRNVGWLNREDTIIAGNGIFIATEQRQRVAPIVERIDVTRID